jgi:hypothetical protein
MPVVSRTDAWDRARQAFADQFEQDGSGFVYRRSQKGAAIRVSAEEHDRFIGEFNSNLRRANWIIYVGLTLVLGGIIALSLLSGSDLSEATIGGPGQRQPVSLRGARPLLLNALPKRLAACNSSASAMASLQGQHLPDW